MENIAHNPEIENKVKGTNFKLDTYDGPLDLLVELIKDKKMDILNIDIAELCFQYLEFINENLDNSKIDEASEYLVMASHLIELKSKKILSILNETVEEETELEIDRLRRQLFLYKQYKDSVSKFRIRQSTRVQFLAKSSDDFDEYIPKEMPEAPLPESIDVQRLIKAWRKVLLEMNTTEEINPSFQINVKTIDLEELENNLSEYIATKKTEGVEFETFVQKFKSDCDLEYKCAIFFMLLHLAKRQLITLEQDEDTKVIYVTQNHDGIVETVNHEVIEAISKQKEISQNLQFDLKNKRKINREDIMNETLEDGLSIKNKVDKKQDLDKELNDAIDKLIHSSKETDIIDDFEIEEELEDELEIDEFDFDDDDEDFDDE
ncbi:MAG: segregation and condensation protein A [Mycoplasma sp.]